jgi:hypothetical protein
MLSLSHSVSLSPTHRHTDSQPHHIHSLIEIVIVSPSCNVILYTEHIYTSRYMYTKNVYKYIVYYLIYYAFLLFPAYCKRFLFSPFGQSSLYSIHTLCIYLFFAIHPRINTLALRGHWCSNKQTHTHRTPIQSEASAKEKKTYIYGNEMCAQALDDEAI